MHITLDQVDLVSALAGVSSVVERRNTIPILGHVLVTASGGGEVAFVGTNLDQEARRIRRGVTAEAGVSTILAMPLYDLARKFDADARIALQRIDGGRMRVSCGRFKIDLATLSPEDFPTFAEHGEAATIEMPAADLDDLIVRARFAVSTEETRYYLGGIYLHRVETGDGVALRGVATDGHRLAHVDAPMAPENLPEFPAAIVPSAALDAFRALLKGGRGETCRLSIGERRIRLDLGGDSLGSKLIEGTYPDYNRVLPREFRTHLRLDRAEMIRAADRCATIAGERSQAVKLEIGEDGLTLSLTQADRGQAEETVDAAVDGPPQTLGLNVRYLLDILGHIEADEIAVSIIDAGSPVQLRKADAAETDPLYVCMPMRT
jgi:DNA polymerase III subunit beta